MILIRSLQYSTHQSQNKSGIWHVGKVSGFHLMLDVVAIAQHEPQ
jgi:hypothetical protein